MPVTLITITAEPLSIDNNFYNYSAEDRILKNILTEDHEVFYSGQNQGKLDYKLINGVNEHDVFRVYYRRAHGEPFVFLGSTNQSSIIQERTIVRGVNSLPEERLQIRLVIPANNISNETIHTQFEGSGKYKKAVLQHSGFQYEGVFTQFGFYRQ